MDLRELSAALEAVENDPIEAAGDDIKALIDRLQHIERLEDRAKELGKSLKAQADEIRLRELPDALQQRDSQSVKLADGRSVHLQTDLHASVVAANRGAFHQWLRENGHDSLITEQVNHQTLKAWVKEQRSMQQPVPDLVTVYPETKAVIRNPKGKA